MVPLLILLSQISLPLSHHLGLNSNVSPSLQEAPPSTPPPESFTTVPYLQRPHLFQYVRPFCPLPAPLKLCFYERGTPVCLATEAPASTQPVVGRRSAICAPRLVNVTQVTGCFSAQFPRLQLRVVSPDWERLG